MIQAIIEFLLRSGRASSVADGNDASAAQKELDFEYDLDEEEEEEEDGRL